MAITVREALQILEGGDYCSLRFITADIKRGASGKVIEIPKCRIARNHKFNKNELDTAVRTGSNGKNPNHNLNFTRNVELPNHRIRKVHPILITHINNIAVL